jgi:PAS domain S-box-containing protein
MMDTGMTPETYAMMASMLKRSKLPVLVKDEDGTFVFLSDHACFLIGARLEDLVGKTDHDFLPQDEADQIRAMDIHIVLTGEEKLFEEEITGQDGSMRTLVTHKRRVSLPGHGRLAHFVIAEIEDVTELRDAERVLRASEEHHRSLIELHPQTPWVANAAGEVIEVGLEWEQFSGRSVGEACGHGWMDSVHPDDLPPMVENWERSIRTGQRLDIECRILTRNGGYRWYRSRAAPKLDHTNNIVRWYGLLEDIHDRQTALQALMESDRILRDHRAKLERLVEARTAEVNEKNAELARLLQQEREVNALQRRFVAMVSHEFRTPLTIIDAAAQRLVRHRDAPSPAYLAEKSLQIKGSVARMVELMESILAAGRLETGVVIVNKRPCSLSDVIELCVRRRQEISATHRIHLAMEDVPNVVEADPDALDRVFSNLLSNAVKYAPNDPDIYVRAWRHEEFVFISIRDTGIGMDAEDLPRLFEPYFRAQSATGIAGTGLGLNIVREIVELHGGRIVVDSEAGQGSTFTVSVPVDHAQNSFRQAA